MILGEESFLKGLLSGEYVWQRNDKYSEDNDLSVKELYFSTAYRNVSIDIGRERVRWGVGYSTSPTDIITESRRPDDPEDRLNRVEGTDVLMIKLLLSEHSLTFVYLPDLELKCQKIDRHSIAVKYSAYTSGLDISGVFLLGENKEAKAGMNASYVMGEALEFHGEFLWSRRQEGLFPDYFRDTNTVYTEPPYKKGNDPAYFVLLGSQYTINFEQGGILNIVSEYYRNGNGLSRKDLKDYAKHIKYSYDIRNEHGYNQIGWAADIFRFPIGMNYLFFRLDYLFFHNNLKAELNSSYSLDDSSFFLQPIFTLKVKDNLSLYVRGDVIFGPDRSEADISPISSVLRIGGVFSF